MSSWKSQSKLAFSTPPIRPNTEMEEISQSQSTNTFPRYFHSDPALLFVSLPTPTIDSKPTLPNPVILQSNVSPRLADTSPSPDGSVHRSDVHQRYEISSS